MYVNNFTSGILTKTGLASIAEGINRKAHAVICAAASEAGLSKASTIARPHRRYLISSLMALIAFVSIHSWTEIGRMEKSETGGINGLAKSQTYRSSKVIRGLTR
jgi:hypothetical protein